jgi:hypothetical protein
MSNIDTKTKEPRVGWWLAVVLIGMIGLQVFKNSSGSNALKSPGQERGDLVLTEDSLPANIGSWRQTRFEPPLPPESLPENQYWWTHSWHYQQTGANAIVSFDQANWQGWHELTDCYVANGWTLERRTLSNDRLQPDTDWKYVLASFTRGETDRCIILFSMFFEDGNPIEPRGSLFGQLTDNDDWKKRLQRRTEYNPSPDEFTGLRAFQSQVFLPFTGEERDDLTSDAIKLHIATRTQIVEINNKRRESQQIAQ